MTLFNYCINWIKKQHNVHLNSGMCGHNSFLVNSQLSDHLQHPSLTLELFGGRVRVGVSAGQVWRGAWKRDGRDIMGLQLVPVRFIIQ